MKSPVFAPTLLAVALVAILAGSALAQAPTPAPKAQAAEKELAQAQAELARAATRVAELSRAHAAPAIHLDQRVIRRPVLGVLLAPDPEAGARITGVTPDGAAAKAGVKSGDRLLSVDGTPVSGADADQRVAKARELLGDLDTKTPIRLGYSRDGRDAVLSVAPEINERVFVWNGEIPEALGDPMFLHGDLQDLANIDIDIKAIQHDLPPGVAPQMRTEIMRLGAHGPCKDKPCNFPMLVEAFRWNGLNLAAVDAQLGRYFGTDKGVLVLSAGEDLAGLQPGDVIRKVDGKAVTSPREAMDALRTKPADSTVAVEYLRDRQTATAQIKVPKAMPLRIPVPPTPPAPPAAPRPPSAARPPQSPSAPAPMARTERRVVIDDDGKAQVWVDSDEHAPPPPPMPPEPPTPPASQSAPLDEN